MTIFEQIQNLLRVVLKDSDLFSKVYFVGGCVRDTVRHKDPHDIDMIVEQNHGSMKLSKYLHKVISKYTTVPFRLGHYPIWSITFTENFEYKCKFYSIKGITLEIADTMDEEFHDKNSRQRNVKFASIEKDILRRDFTVNAGLINLNGEYIYKEYNPTFLHDIEAGIIKCHDKVNPDKIFSDDPLRMLRGIIFAIRFNWEIEERTGQSIIRNADRIKIIANERIIKEIDKIIDIPQGMYQLIILLDKYNLLDKIFPEIYHLKDINQQPDNRNIHLEGKTVYHHVLSVLRNAKPGLVNSLAALFHDVGKNEKTQEFIDGKVRFINHEKLGAVLTRKILANMRYSIDVIKDVTFLIKHHMDIHHIKNEKDYSIKRIRKFIRSVGDYKEQLFDLVNADSAGTIIQYEDGTIGSLPNHLFEYNRINEVIALDSQVIEKPVRIFNGNEIMDFLHIKGKDVGIAINIMLDIQDEFGTDIDREEAKKLIIEKFNFFKSST